MSKYSSQSIVWVTDKLLRLQKINLEEKVSNITIPILHVFLTDYDIVDCAVREL